MKRAQEEVKFAPAGEKLEKASEKMKAAETKLAILQDQTRAAHGKANEAKLKEIQLKGKFDQAVKKYEKTIANMSTQAAIDTRLPKAKVEAFREGAVGAAQELRKEGLRAVKRLGKDVKALGGKAELVAAGFVKDAKAAFAERDSIIRLEKMRDLFETRLDKKITAKEKELKIAPERKAKLEAYVKNQAQADKLQKELGVTDPRRSTELAPLNEGITKFKFRRGERDILPFYKLKQDLPKEGELKRKLEFKQSVEIHKGELSIGKLAQEEYKKAGNFDEAKKNFEALLEAGREVGIQVSL